MPLGFGLLVIMRPFKAAVRVGFEEPPNVVVPATCVRRSLLPRRILRRPIAEMLAVHVHPRLVVGKCSLLELNQPR